MYTSHLTETEQNRTYKEQHISIVLIVKLANQNIYSPPNSINNILMHFIGFLSCWQSDRVS